MIKLSKTFRFESAHRLAKGYKGKCANIHGHSWNGCLTVTCDGTDEMDMGVDYSVLGKFLKQIEDKFDHKLLLYRDDPIADYIEKTAQECGEKVDVVRLWKNPTSEALAEYIFAAATGYVLAHGIKCEVFSVTVNETCTTACEYTDPNLINELRVGNYNETNDIHSTS